jgi:hypothetical protein
MRLQLRAYASEEGTEGNEGNEKCGSAMAGFLRDLIRLPDAQYPHRRDNRLMSATAIYLQSISTPIFIGLLIVSSTVKNHSFITHQQPNRRAEAIGHALQFKRTGLVNWQ